MSATRALGRWAFRLVRREFRQQLLVLSLVAVSLALVSLGTSLLTNSTTPQIRTGTATHIVSVSGGEEVRVDKRVRTLAEELVGSDSNAVIHTTFTRKAVRSNKAPNRFDLADETEKNPFGADIITVTQGRAPAASNEIALTGRLMSVTSSRIQSGLMILGTSYTVVGEIEDPNDLSRLFAVVPKSTVPSPDEARLLIRASNTAVKATNVFADGAGHIETVSMHTNARLTGELFSLVIGAMAMLEVALLCTAGFGVLAKRRSQEFALLASIGARSRHLKRAMLLNGLAVGIAGGIAGLFLGFALNLVFQPWLEEAIGKRLGAASFPRSTLLPFLGLAVLTSTAAAWWPARSAARASIVSALKSRRPRRGHPYRTGLFAVVIVVVAAFAHDRFVRSEQTALATIAFICGVIGILLIGPMLISAVGSSSNHLPLPARIASRSLVRHQSRSSLALAALVLALGGAVSLTVVGVFADDYNRSVEPVAPTNVALIRPKTFAGALSIPREPLDLAALTPSLDALRHAFPKGEFVPVYVAAYPPGTPEPSMRWAAGPQRHVVRVSGVKVDRTPTESNPDPRMIVTAHDPAWIATPELLRAWSLRPELAESSAGLLGPGTLQGYLNDNAGDFFGTKPKTERLGRSGNGIVPMFWLPASEARRRNYEPVLIGWTLKLNAPLTEFDSETLVAEAGDKFEFVHADTQPFRPSPIRRIALFAGSAIGFTILAIIGGLLRSESADEDHAFIAVGAKRRTRRAVSGATTGLLAIYGGLLAIPFGLLTTVGMRAAMRQTRMAFALPVDAVGVVLVLFPTVAALCAWLFAKATPRSLPRRM